MKRKLIYLALLLLFCQSIVLAQNRIMRWGDVPMLDLQSTSYEKDPSANALILGDLGKITIYSSNTGYEYSLNRHKRIKIFNKKGFEHADIIIPFYSRNGIEIIKNVRAQIISPSGKKYVLTKKETFEEKYNEFYSLVKFTFPNLEEGAVIEYQYTLISKNVTQLDTWYFHNELPTRYSELKVTVGTGFSYITLFEGAETMDKTQKPDGTTVLKSGDSEMRIRSGYYLMRDAPAIKEEGFMTTINDYRARIRFQLQEVNYPDGTKQSFLSTWGEVAEDMMKDQEFGAQFKKKRNFKRILEEIEPKLTNVADREEKIEQIYDFIASKMAWNGRHGIFVKKSLDEAFEKKSGSAVELNLMFLALLNYFDIEALPVLTSTRDHGKLILDYPIMDQFNHVMVLITNEEGKGGRLADIPSQIRPLGLPEINSLNYFGWLVRVGAPEWISIKAPLGTDAFHTKIELQEEGVQCAMTARFSNYNAISERSKYFEAPDGEYWKSRLSERLPEVQIDSFGVRNSTEVKRSFVNTMRFSADAVALQNGDYIYLSPILYSNFSENPFKLDERFYPVDFPYPFEELYTTTILIPEGYNVEELPENKSYDLGNNKGSFKYSVEQKEKSIILKSQIKIQNLKVLPKQYSALKNMFDIMLEKHNEQIVLRKEN